MDYEDELLADLQSEGDEQEELEVKTDKTKSLEEKLDDLVAHHESRFIDIERVEDVGSISGVLAVVDELKERLAKYSNQESSDYFELISWLNHEESEEFQFIVRVNALLAVIHEEIDLIHSVAKGQYQVVFPELETLVLSGVDYAKTILLIKQDLVNLRDYEAQLKEFISGEKVLVIIMAGLQQVKHLFFLDDKDMTRVLQCCELILQLNDLLQHLSDFVAQKISKYAPNVTEIVGPVTTSQLLISLGSLKQLSLTPSCNIPSLGVRDLSSTSKVASRTVRQTGYLFHCDLIKFLPEDIVKPAMRITSAKIVLAARIDLSKSSADGSLGSKYLQEIHAKIEKLLAPPEQQPDKALPVPVEQKSKKRGGRRFRKMKERFQMSELRRAQNKMEFGKQEETVTDSFGEEIGLGMSRTKSLGDGRIRAPKLNLSTGAKMSKAMAKRVEDAAQKNSLGLNLLPQPALVPVTKRQLPTLDGLEHPTKRQHT